MTPDSSSHERPPFEADVIPTLHQDAALATVPQAVSLALDARLAEKQALMAMSEDLVMNLRPEIERITTEVVQKTLLGVWEQRARRYQEE